MIAAASNSERELVAFADACLAPKMRSMLEFAEQEIILPDGPFAGLRFRVDRQPYAGLLLASLDGARTSRWRRRVITGPTQSGKTLSAFVIPTLWHLFERGENVICGVPHLEMAGDKWEDDFKPVIEGSRYRDLLPTSGRGSRGGTPTTIRFKNGASLRFMAGGGGPKQRAGKTTRVLVVTETDGMDEPGDSASMEGDKISQLEGRIRAHGLSGLVYMECTVTTTEGRTWREYQASTASRLICPCPHCLRWVTPEREDLVGWKDAETKLAAGRAAHFACPECHHAIDEQQRREMNRVCRLLHKGQEVTDAGEIVGQPVETDTFGFRWGAFNNLFAPIEQLAQEEWTAAQAEDQANAETVRKQQAWATPVEPDRTESVELTKAIIRGSDSRYGGRCNKLPRGVVPDDCQCVTVHVDPGWSTYRQTFWWGAVAHCGTPRRRHVVVYDTFPTRMATVTDEAHVVACLESIRQTLAAEPIRDAQGREVPVRVKTVDVGTMTDAICDWIAVHASEGWRAYKGLGSSEDAHRNKQYVHPTKCSDSVRVAPYMDRWYESMQSLRSGWPIWVVNADVDTYKLRVHQAFMLPPLDDKDEPRPGSVTLWGDDPIVHHVLSDHLLAERFEAEFKQGRGERRRWVKKEKENHLLDVLAGALVGEGVAAGMMTQATPIPAIVSTGRRRPTGRTW